eukprot:Opistho-2@80680
MLSLRAARGLCRPSSVRHSRWQSTSGNDELRNLFVYTEPVASALAEGRPVVALESTIVAHGMPYPDNLTTALEVEAVVRSKNAVPATIAVLDGKIHIGLTREEIERVARAGAAARKTSRRDLPLVLAQKHIGATTVSGTMILAHLAGISTFVTGGIGGVHRGGESSMDISADLTELGRTPVNVVCAGIKSILDIGRSLEYLETQGVGVITYGPTPQFPAFFTPHSGFDAPAHLNSASAIARVAHAKDMLGLQTGMVVAVPIPAEYAADRAIIEEATRRALEDASLQGVGGRDATPFVLKRLAELTRGESLKANVALVKNNAAVGAEIAFELSRLRVDGGFSLRAGGDKQQAIRVAAAAAAATATSIAAAHTREAGDATSHAPDGGLSAPNIIAPCNAVKNARKRPVVVGGAIVDLVARPRPGHPLIARSSNPGRVRESYGGVARNIADCLARLRLDPLLITAIGSDARGGALIRHSQSIGMRTDGFLQVDGYDTAVYNAILDTEGELVVGVTDGDVFEAIGLDTVSVHADVIRSSPMTCIDGNVSDDTLRFVANLCEESKVPLLFEPTSVEKARNAVDAGIISKVHIIKPNADELEAMAAATGLSRNSTLAAEAELSGLCDNGGIPHEYMEHVERGLHMLNFVRYVVITLGPGGVILCRKSSDSNTRTAKHFPAGPPVSVVNVTGAGDSLVGGLVYGIVTGRGYDTAVRCGIVAARHSLRHFDAVAPSICPDIMDDVHLDREYPIVCKV